MKHTLVGMVVGAAAAATALGGGADATTPPSLYRNCSHFNAKYPHGVGLVAARDHTTSGDPVATFVNNNRVYKLAMKYNDDLDREKTTSLRRRLNDFCEVDAAARRSP
jgi:hypothetical protein